MATVITDYNARYNLADRKPPITMIRNNGGQPQDDICFLDYVLQFHEKRQTRLELSLSCLGLSCFYQSQTSKWQT